MATLVFHGCPASFQKTAWPCARGCDSNIKKTQLPGTCVVSMLDWVAVCNILLKQQNYAWGTFLMGGGSLGHQTWQGILAKFSFQDLSTQIKSYNKLTDTYLFVPNPFCARLPIPKYINANIKERIRKTCGRAKGPTLNHIRWGAWQVHACFPFFLMAIQTVSNGSGKSLGQTCAHHWRLANDECLTLQD